MNRSLNRRFLLALVLASAVLAGAVHGLHAVQARRLSGSLLRWAETAEAGGKLDEAAQLYARHLALEPGDTATLARLGLTRAAVATAPHERLEACLLLERVAGQLPDRTDVRRAIVRLGMHPSVGRYREAAAQLRVLLGAAPDDAEAEGQLGRCLAEIGEYAEAAEWFARATEHDPENPDHAACLAALLRQRLGRPRDADAVIEAMTESTPTAPAFLAASRYWRQAGVPERFAAAVAEARRLAPDDAEALLAAAEVARGRGDAAAAIEILRRGVEHHPKVPAFHLSLATLHGEARRLPEAVAAARAGLQALPEHTDLLWTLADGLIRSGQLAEVPDLLDRLRRAGAADALIEFHEAGVLMTREDWAAACRVLRPLPAHLADRTWAAREANCRLATCYEQLGDLDGSQAAWRAALTIDPQWVPARTGLAVVLARLGRADEALETYRAVAPQAPAATVEIARLLLAREANRPADRRRWDEVEEAVSAAERVQPDAVEVPLLRAAVFALRNRPDDARRELDKARDRFPREPGPWVALSELEARAAGPDAALATLGRAEQTVGDVVDFRLAKAKLLAGRSDPMARSSLAALDAGLERFGPAERGRLLRGLAELAGRTGGPAEAASAWKRFGTERLGDPAAQFTRLEAALARDDGGAAREALAALRAIDGEEGSTWRVGRASLLIWQAMKGDASGLDQAAELLAAAGRQRPNWSRVPLGLARLSDFRGDRDASISGYQRAVELGEHSPAVVRRLVGLLCERHRHADADRVLQQLPAAIRETGEILRLTAEVALATRDDRRAVALARQAVPDGATAYADLLWLSRIFWAAGQPADAEPPLRRAVAVASDRAECWAALADYLARLNRKAEAVQILADAGGKLPPEAAVALAPSYEAVGQAEKARDLYRTALAARPNDPALLRGAALVHLRAGETEPAEALLRRLVTGPRSSDAAWARRTLAVMLASRRDVRAARRALELLGPPTTNESAADLQTRAVVLAAQPERERRHEAVEILERLAARGTLAAANRLLLGQLYDGLGDWARARAHLLASLAGPTENSPALAYYVRALLRRDDRAEAAVWLAKLERAQPGSYAAIELGARLYCARGRAAEAEVLVADYLGKPGAQVRSVAALADELGLAKTAEAAYKRLATDAAHPEDALALATYLGRQGRTTEALAACGQARRACPVEAVAAAGVAILMAAPDPSPNEWRQVAGWVDEAVRVRPTVSAVAGLRAALLSLEGRTAEAIALYRQVVADDPENALARNNLAFLLAATGGPAAEARTLLERARALAGPIPELRITEAFVEIRADRPEVAARLLRELADESPSAVAYYHLACAHAMAGDRAAALAALNAARRLHLKPTDLHPLARPAYKQLLADLDQRGTP